MCLRRRLLARAAEHGQEGRPISCALYVPLSMGVRRPSVRGVHLCLPTSSVPSGTVPRCHVAACCPRPVSFKHVDSVRLVHT